MSEIELTQGQVAEDMTDLVRDAEALLTATAGQTDSKLTEIRNRLSGAVANARSTCRKLQGQASQQLKQGIEQTDATVRAHPWESVGVAFAVGLVVGVLVGRR
ncbi:MAG TPA: DUF883 family protein [Verrucomicrobiota bacterium]|nr:DUF883 family protein [Verrucomicrobiota bacterium]